MLPKRLIVGAFLLVGIGILFAMDSHSLRLCKNTFLLTVGTLAFALPVGCGLAWALFRTDAIGYQFGFIFAVNTDTP